MIQFIQHRVNRIKDLNSVSFQNGVEVDLRSCPLPNGFIYLAHDAWSKGDSFEKWLKVYKKRKIKGPLILNTKEDGLEEKIISMMKKYKISNYFFLDTSIPTLVRLSLKMNISQFAVRVSEYEDVKMALQFEGKVKWVWLDCFNGRPLSFAAMRSLKDRFKICLVSPELHTGSIKKISQFKRLAQHCDAICTKVPLIWCELLK